MLRFIHTRFHLAFTPSFSLIISHSGATVVRPTRPALWQNQTNPQPKKKKKGEWGSSG